MNCIELFLEQSRDKRDRPALWMPSGGVVTFSELERFSAKAQTLCLRSGLAPGDSVLLFEGIGPRLYASVLGILALGISIVLVEPWMKVGDIHRIMEIVRPKLFLAGWLGKAWGLRVSAIRSIPQWAGTGALAGEAGGRDFHLEQVDAETPGVMVFTSGTSGNPKGIVRGHGFLLEQHNTINRNLGLDRFPGPDLCIFTNFVLSNLASGRCSVIIPHSWKASALAEVDSLPENLQPETLACGPTFLAHMIDRVELKRLKTVHVGGALTDCRTFEAGFARWPEVHWVLGYGSSEAEPVAVTDAAPAVRESRARGCFQTLLVGRPVPEIAYNLEPESLWVSGRHVCPRYIGNDQANRLYKRTDEAGRIWHCMGDRIVADEAGWWYQGRSEQRPADFKLEQKIYSLLDSSASFVFTDAAGRRHLLGEGLKAHRDRILRECPELEGVIEAKVYRDKRHRAKIDRGLSVKKGAKWLAG